MSSTNASSSLLGQAKPNIFIFVVGPTGAGKSTFINNALGKPNAMVVGHALSPCTTKVECRELETSLLPESIQSYRVFLVDTPGFNADENFNVRKCMSAKVCEWLKSFSEPKLYHAGIIYIHNLSHTRIAAFPAKELQLLRRAFSSEPDNDISSNIYTRIALVANMMPQGLDEGEVANKEKELRNVQWKELVDRGSMFCRSTGYPNSNAQEIVVELVKQVKDPLPAIQDGLVKLGQYYPPTSRYRFSRSRSKPKDTQHLMTDLDHDNTESVQEQHSGSGGKAIRFSKQTFNKVKAKALNLGKGKARRQGSMPVESSQDTAKSSTLSDQKLDPNAPGNPIEAKRKSRSSPDVTPSARASQDKKDDEVRENQVADASTSGLYEGDIVENLVQEVRECLAILAPKEKLEMAKRIRNIIHTKHPHELEGLNSPSGAGSTVAGAAADIPLV